MSRPPTNKSSQSKEPRNQSSHKDSHSLDKSNLTKSRVSVNKYVHHLWSS